MLEAVSVCAVVISFKPSPDILKNVQLLCKQVGHVVVVDNTPCSGSINVLNDLECLGNCTLIRNEKNLGIAAALNIGIGYAIEQGFSWIITFDQDSRISDGYIEGMFSGYREAAKTSEVGILFPRYRDAQLGVFLRTHRAKNGDAFACMTSGSMIHADTFRSFGKMEEKFFIDYVDLEYSFRLRSAGLKIIECSNVVLEHSLGRITLHRLFGREFSTTNHSAKRRYYITRNRFVLIKRYFVKDREWAIADLKGLIVDSIKICLAEKDKVIKGKYMLRGIYDAMLNRLGPRVPL